MNLGMGHYMRISDQRFGLDNPVVYWFVVRQHRTGSWLLGEW